jgi:4-amino-4-deoxy-L-arabinose transferase-like glycosyltransferase
MNLDGRRLIAALMACEAASLVVMSALHLTGTLGQGNTGSGAGIPEAIIAAVLASGAAVLVRAPERGRRTALAAIVFAIAGFIIGLTFTVRGGDPVDVAYHATVLPILILTAALAARLPGYLSQVAG